MNKDFVGETKNNFLLENYMPFMPFIEDRLKKISDEITAKACLIQHPKSVN